MNKKKVVLVILGSIIVVLLVFSAGVYCGTQLERLDILCPLTPTPVILTQDIFHESGLHLPAGTIVPLYSCEYAERFSVRYSIPHGMYETEHPLFTPYVPVTEEDALALQRGTLYQYEMMPTGHTALPTP
jgi:hypothetical protein